MWLKLLNWAWMSFEMDRSQFQCFVADFRVHDSRELDLASREFHSNKEHMTDLWLANCWLIGITFLHLNWCIRHCSNCDTRKHVECNKYWCHRNTIFEFWTIPLIPYGLFLIGDFPQHTLVIMLFAFDIGLVHLHFCSFAARKPTSKTCALFYCSVWNKWVHNLVDKWKFARIISSEHVAKQCIQQPNTS